MLSSIHLSGNVRLFSTKSDFANTAEDIMYRNFISWIDNACQAKSNAP